MGYRYFWKHLYIYWCCLLKWFKLHIFPTWKQKIPRHAAMPGVHSPFCRRKKCRWLRLSRCQWNCIPHPLVNPMKSQMKGMGFGTLIPNSYGLWSHPPGDGKKLFLRGQVSVVWYQPPKFITCFTEKRRIGVGNLQESDSQVVLVTLLGGVTYVFMFWKHDCARAFKKSTQVTNTSDFWHFCHNTFLSNGFHSVVDPLP